MTYPIEGLPPRAMRDLVIDEIRQKMVDNPKIVFLSADFGSPALDRLAAEFPTRFYNVGIAEQNLINVATGMALEGYIVYAYAIAVFITMRCYEQIRVNLAILGQLRPMNVNLIGVGAGVSYDVSGPTHHCIEDLSVMRTLPNLGFVSPSDYGMAKMWVDHTINTMGAKYLRLDSKPLPRVYSEEDLKAISIEKGYVELPGLQSKSVPQVIVSTGYMTHKALRIKQQFDASGKTLGVIDLFNLKTADQASLKKALSKYTQILTLEEGFLNRGGLDSLVKNLFSTQESVQIHSMGYGESYVFDIGNREYIHDKNGISEEQVAAYLTQWKH